MVFETVTLTVITLLLFVLLFIRKAGKLKLLLGILTAISALISMVCFVIMMNVGNRLDAGALLYAPCAIYLVIAIWGGIAAALSRRKLRIDKAARDIASGKTEV